MSEFLQIAVSILAAIFAASERLFPLVEQSGHEGSLSFGYVAQPDQVGLGFGRGGREGAP